MNNDSDDDNVIKAMAMLQLTTGLVMIGLALAVRAVLACVRVGNQSIYGAKHCHVPQPDVTATPHINGAKYAVTHCQQHAKPSVVTASHHAQPSPP